MFLATSWVWQAIRREANKEVEANIRKVVKPEQGRRQWGLNRESRSEKDLEG